MIKSRCYTDSPGTFLLVAQSQLLSIVDDLSARCGVSCSPISKVQGIIFIRNFLRSTIIILKASLKNTNSILLMNKNSTHSTPHFVIMIATKLLINSSKLKMKKNPIIFTFHSENRLLFNDNVWELNDTLKSEPNDRIVMNGSHKTVPFSS